MDFGRKLIHYESVATKSKICHIETATNNNNSSSSSSTTNNIEKNDKTPSSIPLDDMLIHAANQAAVDLMLGNPARNLTPSSVINSNNNNNSSSLSSTTKTTENRCNNNNSNSNNRTNNNAVSIATTTTATSLIQKRMIDSSLYPERVIPQSETIQPNQLVVIFESYDNLNFCYAEMGAIFYNRNGHFYHDDFIGKPYGCKIRSRNNRGYGFVYLLKPTPELWARSLQHRTQIIHELDSSMIIFYLNLRPNMTVCESGTGSGAMSHCILRTIAPAGTLHTYEFNAIRAKKAKNEFHNNGVGHLVTVHHKSVYGKQQQQQQPEKEETTTTSTTTTSTTIIMKPGFDLPQGSVDAVILDLPEPWLAIPYAAYVMKCNARIASYSPCIEQAQKTIQIMKQRGYHSIKTIEFRLKEYYVDEVEHDILPSREKRPRTAAAAAAMVAAAAAANNNSNNNANNGNHNNNNSTTTTATTTIKNYDTTTTTNNNMNNNNNNNSNNKTNDMAIEEEDDDDEEVGNNNNNNTIPRDGEDTGEEADNEKSEYETEGDQTSLATATGSLEYDEKAAAVIAANTTTNRGGCGNSNNKNTSIKTSTTGGGGTTTIVNGGGVGSTTVGTNILPTTNTTTNTTTTLGGNEMKRKKYLVARPSHMMRGHTAFLTFATAGNKLQPDPNNE